MASSLIVVGSAGRAHGSAYTEPRLLAAPATSDYSSFCLICATWYFAQRVHTCSKCHAGIFRWVRNDDLKLFRSRSSLSGF